MAGTYVICGSCCHEHDAPNGPTGCCPEHGPFMYFCRDCHEARRTQSTDQEDQS